MTFRRNPLDGSSELAILAPWEGLALVIGAGLHNLEGAGATLAL